MFRQARCAVFAATATIFGCLLLLGNAGCKKQTAKVEKSETQPPTIERHDLPAAITASIGMKLTLIPPGEFMMGGDEPADSAAAFYIKNYGEEFLMADFFQYFDGAYYGKSPLDDPRGPKRGLLRVLRGGSWFDWPDRVRSAARFGRVPGDRFFQIGFRVARDP